MKIGESVRINCMIDWHTQSSGFRGGGFPGNQETMELHPCIHA